MNLRGRTVALYGRFTPGVRDRLAGAIARRGGAVTRDLTRRCHVLVVGALAATLVDGGQLGQRLAAARARRAPVFGERRFVETLVAAQEPGCTLPIAAAAAQSSLGLEQIETLAAFDIVCVSDGLCRFGDVGALRTAAELLGAGRSLSDAVRILVRARDLAPKGRHKIVLDPHGRAALQWDNGTTTLEGQGVLPLTGDAATIEDLFEAAAIAETEGDLAEAARLYDLSTRFDKKDPIAPFNLGNVRLMSQAFDLAVLAYHLALARDPGFAEARYNLAQAYEAQGKADLARDSLQRVLELDPEHGDALFNLAQLELKRGDLDAAKALYESYLAGDPPPEWAAKARKAITYCSARHTA